MTTERSGTTIIEAARDLMAVCSPVTGTRATGSLLLKAKPGQGTVYLPANWHFIAQVNNAAREELLFKTAAGPNRARYPDGKRQKASESEPDAESWWEVTEAGVAVAVTSIIGGKRHNLPAGTVMRFDPLCPGLEDTGVLLEPGTTGGTDPTWLGGCMSMVQFEQLTGVTASLDAFRSQTGKFPAVVLVWDGSEPADGTTQSSMSRGDTRAGPGSQLFKERFNIFVLSQRSDGDHMRRNEGLKLLDDLTFWLTDAQEADGQRFSAPTGVQVRGRSRVAGDGVAYQQLYIYMLQVSVTTVWRRYDSRSFSPWLLAHNEFLTYQKDAEGARKVIVDQDIDMSEDP
jgi:hypothetical protein